MKEATTAIERNVYLAVPAENVWQGITTPEIVSRYFLTPLLKIDLKVGGVMHYESLGAVTVEAKILELEEGKKLVHSFAFTPDTHEEVEADPPTQVSYEIWPLGEMSFLELRHKGFPSRNRTFQNATVGWDKNLSGLKTVLETGKVLPWPES